MSYESRAVSTRVTRLTGSDQPKDGTGQRSTLSRYLIHTARQAFASLDLGAVGRGEHYLNSHVPSGGRWLLVDAVHNRLTLLIHTWTSPKTVNTTVRTTAAFPTWQLEF
ncbi:hypothetical protein WJX72_009254 [[Myrmecia] bisecta]|uniref:Uncharacterized protein n=1 Tax=[Myrmecia] bisecta TaxID=41462 RepID=A0AAW1PKX3_9CHLO